MEKLNLYLPKDKHDFDSVTVLNNLGNSKVILLIPSLLEWLQDINWPIATEIAKLLLKYPEETIPHVKEVLNAKDDRWKEWCLRYFVMELPDDFIIEFKDELIRIAYDPTKGEELEEVNETAQMILELIKDR
ncbi:DUF5071 domain-containing protein [Paenibacillus sp. KN14-4R]|uniref:DUF5071 domain-containing protein n=1 Tax=Paenibacillus sp. KN14-4R TaxID=3445773 RepID=UPI003F9F826A